MENSQNSRLIKFTFQCTFIGICCNKAVAFDIKAQLVANHLHKLCSSINIIIRRVTSKYDKHVDRTVDCDHLGQYCSVVVLRLLRLFNRINQLTTLMTIKYNRSCPRDLVLKKLNKIRNSCPMPHTINHL